MRKPLDEIHVLDTQFQAFHHAQAAAVEQFDDQPVGTRQQLDNVDGLFPGQNGRQATRLFGLNGVDSAIQFYFEYITIEEKDGVERLILGRGGDVALHGQVGQVCLDLVHPHLPWMAFVVEEDEALDPIGVSLFGARGVMFEADHVPYLVEQFS